jgi:putative hydrolase of the HAD superfamily
MTRCLMLDVDGGVVKGRPEDGRSWAADIERDLGIDPERLYAVFFAPYWDDIVTGRRPLLGVLEGCLPDLSPSLGVQAFVDYWFERDSAVDEAVLAACDVLRGRGVRVFLATNQEHLRARHLMGLLGLGDRVDGMIYSAAIAARKPQRGFFEAAVARAGASPAETLLVDDTGANVDAALEAGWQAIQWSSGSNLVDLFDGR